MIAQEVRIARTRSGWSAQRTLRVLGIPPATFYRQGGFRAAPRVPRSVAPDEALPEQRAAVRACAQAHPELHHRTLAWTMIDQDVASLSPSTVYRILREAGLSARWTAPVTRARAPLPRPTRPGESWQTDLRYVKVAGRTYYLLVFLDIYSRFIVHHELLRWMDGDTVAQAAQRALERIPQGDRGRIRLQSDNGSALISGDFAKILAAHGVGHHRIYPHTPEQNGFVERVMRTLGEPLHEEELATFAQAGQAIDEIVHWYNFARLHRALDYVTPAAHHDGTAEQTHEHRRRKLAAARAHRRKINLIRPPRPRPEPEITSGHATTLTSPLSHYA